jgi:hypothetical protein
VLGRSCHIPAIVEEEIAMDFPVDGSVVPNNMQAPQEKQHETGSRVTADILSF